MILDIKKFKVVKDIEKMITHVTNTGDHEHRCFGINIIYRNFKCNDHVQENLWDWFNFLSNRSNDYKQLIQILKDHNIDYCVGKIDRFYYISINASEIIDCVYEDCDVYEDYRYKE